MTDRLDQKLEDHIESDRDTNRRRDDDINKLYLAVNKIATNELVHLKADIGEVKIKMDMGFKGIEERFVRLEKVLWFMILGTISAIGTLAEQVIKFLFN
jgi:hypothetical protein